MPKAQKKYTARNNRPGKKRRSGRKPKVVKLRPWSIFVIAVTLVILICLPIKRSKSIDDHGARIPEQFHGEFGIDISHNNKGEIIWDSLRVMTDKKGYTVRDIRAAKDIRPVSFVFIKATEGQGFIDENFKKNWKAAADHGIERGAYHFFRSSKDPVRQANSYIRTVGKLRHSDLPPVLDIETTHKGITKKQLNEKALTWLQTVEKHYGRKPIVYTYDSFAKDWLSKEILDNYPIWIAHYEAKSPVFGNWTYWQFTDKAIVYGIERKVDLSIRRAD